MTLSEAAARVEAIETELAAARAERDSAIVAAHAEGASLRTIAAQARVAHERVRRIVGDFGDLLSTSEAVAVSGLGTKVFLRRALEAGVRMVEVDGQARFRRADVEALQA